MPDSVREWLEGIGFAEYVEAFVGNAVDLELLSHLTNEDLKDLGVVKLGDRKKLLLAIDRLADHAETETTKADFTPQPEDNRIDAERRQLTVMFVDLVDSTKLSRRFDPEDLRDLLRVYQNVVSGEVIRFDGYIAQYMGDGVLAYFGWPKAYEDQAERAVRAALRVIDTIQEQKFPADATVTLRIGIASGQVVVGDIVGEGGTEVAAVTGETPNLAARLQEFAKPGQIVICDSTKRLVGHAFKQQSMGRQQFKGFADPIPVWRLLEEAAASSRFSTVTSGNLLPFVGRKAEIGLLLDRWELAKSKCGQAVFVSGEAGIGKSRLLQAVYEDVAIETHFRLRLQSSPYHKSSAFYPLARQLEQGARIFSHDTADEKRQKLESLLRLAGDDAAPHLQVLAPLLSIPLDADEITPQMTADELRLRTIDALIEQCVGLSRRKPTLFVLEDAHWTDPSTEEAVRRLTQEIADESVLILITHRPEWQPDWATGYDHIAHLTLPRMSPAHAAQMVRNAAGDTANPEDIERIAERTDGIPLFIEELARSIYETGNRPDIAVGEIPETLQGLLLARLDQLDPEIRELAQVGAVIGREFTRNLLGETLRRTERLDAGLDQLVRSRLVHQGGDGQSRRYVFRHALIQEAAYGSLLVRRRQAYHRDIAAALERESSSGADIPPELIAQHFSSAEDTVNAVSWWLKAGKRSLDRSAIVEAVEHLERGADLAALLEENEANLRVRVEVYCELGNARTKAGDLQNALEAFEESARLARRVMSGTVLARAAVGFELAEFHLGKNSENSIALLEEAVALLSKEDSDDLCHVLSSLGRASNMIGSLEFSQKYFSEAIAMARRLDDSRALFEAIYHQFYTIVTGKIENARESITELYRLAIQIDDPQRIIRTESWRTFYFLLEGDREKLDASLLSLKTQSDEHKFAVYSWVAESASVITAFLDGNFVAAEQSAEEVFDHGQKMRLESAHGVYGTQMFTIRREQGRLAEVAPIIKKFVDEHPGEATWRPGLALIASDLGFVDAARKTFEELAENGFDISHDAKRSTTLSYVSEVCARLNDRVRAEMLYKLLKPYDGLTITMGVTTMCYGAAARYLGLLATTLEDWELAAGHFESAIAQNETFRAWPWLAHSQTDYAAMLQRRGDRRDAGLTNELLASARSAAEEYDMAMLQGRIRALQH